jgi:hypothetical protein
LLVCISVYFVVVAVSDCIKYDVLHNAEFLSDIRPLYSAIKRVADFVVPNEYGLLRKDKWLIGVGIARPLLKRMIGKLESALSPRCPSRVTLYFSSESHIHALRNVLLLSGIACNRTVATTLDAIELNYLSHAVFRLYEDVSKPLDDPLRYYVNVQFSPGAALDPHIFAEAGHTLPVSRPVPVNGRVPFHLFKVRLSPSEPSPHACCDCRLLRLLVTRDCAVLLRDAGRHCSWILTRCRACDVCISCSGHLQRFDVGRAAATRIHAPVDWAELHAQHRERTTANTVGRAVCGTITAQMKRCALIVFRAAHRQRQFFRFFLRLSSP